MSLTMQISNRHIAALILAGSLAALGGAFTAQYGFNMRPCNLCLIQRVPFVLAALLSVVALLGPEARRGGVLTVAGGVILINAAIAFGHVGVERHWWASPVCAGADTKGRIKLDDLMAEMDRPGEVPCDQPPWEWHGVTMAGLNIPYSAGLGLMVLGLVRRNRRR